jgi:hypothetical protein
MPDVNSIETHRIISWMSGVQHLAQQKVSRFRDSVRVETVKGKLATFDQYLPVELVEVTGRHATTPLTPVDRARRAVFSTRYAGSELIDEDDVDEVLNDPAGPVGVAFQRGSARKMDAVLSAAFFATAYTGENGTTGVDFPASSDFNIPVGTSNLTIEKLLLTKVTLDENENDEDDTRYIAATAKCLAKGLLAESEIQSIDTSEIKALALGSIDTYMGFTFKRYEKLGGAEATRECAAWTENSMLLGMGLEPMAKSSIRDDLNYAHQIYWRERLGATRMNETGVVKIICNETVTST